MTKENLYKCIALVVGAAAFQFGHMNNEYYYLAVYGFIAVILGLLTWAYYGKGLQFQIAGILFLCSFNPLCKEILGCGDMLLWTDYIFGFGALVLLVVLLIKTIWNYGK